MKNIKLPHVIIGGFILLVIAIVTVSIVVMQSNRAAEAEDEKLTGTTSEIDPVSGLPVTEDAERDHDTYGIDIAFIGFGKLVERGISMQQVTAIQDKFSEFSGSLPDPIERISLYQDSIGRILPSQSENDYHEVHFKVQADQEVDYDAVITYEGISDVDMTITDPEGKTHKL